MTRNGDCVKELSLPKTIPGDTSETIDQECAVAHPLLWDLDSPNLYKAETTLTVEGQKTHEMLSTFGIRTISADAVNGFRLNGKTIKLDGTSMGAGNACVGTASFYRAEYRRMEITKKAGFNTFRMGNMARRPRFLTPAMIWVCWFPYLLRISVDWRL